jgi:hypothetical protein
VPTTPGAYTTAGPETEIGTCSFLTKLNQTGTGLVYSTRLRTVCNATEVAVDSSGNAYILQDSQGCCIPPVTPGAHDTQRNGVDIYVMKLNATGTGLMYGSFLGGSDAEFPAAIAVLGGGAVAIAGQTSSTDFPTTAGAYDESYNGTGDTFITKLQAYDGYPRPRGATPTRFALVLAYKQCLGSGNRTHGPPLAHPSCAPPQQGSDFLTVGTADANAKPALNEGFVRFETLPGNPATPAVDEADIKIDIFMDDVFTKAPLDDYAGELRPEVSIRITDRDVPNSVMSTVQDFLFPFVVPCAPTADPAEGSTCSYSTTVDSIIPGAIVEGKRAMWTLGAVNVYDGGSDGDADTLFGNTVLARPGVFVP